MQDAGAPEQNEEQHAEQPLVHPSVARARALVAAKESASRRRMADELMASQQFNRAASLLRQVQSI